MSVHVTIKTVIICVIFGFLVIINPFLCMDMMNSTFLLVWSAAGVVHLRVAGTGSYRKLLMFTIIILILLPLYQTFQIIALKVWKSKENESKNGTIASDIVQNGTLSHFPVENDPIVVYNLFSQNETAWNQSTEKDAGNNHANDLVLFWVMNLAVLHGVAAGTVIVVKHYEVREEGIQLLLYSLLSGIHTISAISIEMIICAGISTNENGNVKIMKENSQDVDCFSRTIYLLSMSLSAASFFWWIDQTRQMLVREEEENVNGPRNRTRHVGNYIRILFSHRRFARRPAQVLSLGTVYEEA